MNRLARTLTAILTAAVMLATATPATAAGLILSHRSGFVDGKLRNSYWFNPESTLATITWKLHCYYGRGPAALNIMFYRSHDGANILNAFPRGYWVTGHIVFSADENIKYVYWATTSGWPTDCRFDILATDPAITITDAP